MLSRTHSTASAWPRLIDVARQAIRDGYAFVFLTLALCLVVPFGGVGIVALGALYQIAVSKLKLIGEAVRLYFGPWLRSDAFALNLLILTVTLLELALIWHHGDSSGEFENQLKQYLAALAVLLTIRRFPTETIVWGAAIGCVLAGLVALHDTVVLDLPRAEGPTNAIRFGMVAALLAMFSWIGALFGRMPRPQRMFMAGAAAAGIFAVFASASRGAVIAVPVMLLLLIPRIWRWSRPMAVVATGMFVLFSLSLGLWQISTLRHGLANTASMIESVISGGRVSEHSARDRVEMLRLSADLFSKHPWLGAGSVGWDEAVAEQIRTSPPGVALDEAFNQPHNQYANDFAKGGVVRGLGGLAMLLMPLWFFLKRHPFKFRRTALAPLLGVVTCVAYAVFGLTEAVMDLSLTASLYSILIFYLIAASEGAPLAAGVRSGKAAD